MMAGCFQQQARGLPRYGDSAMELTPQQAEAVCRAGHSDRIRACLVIPLDDPDPQSAERIAMLVAPYLRHVSVRYDVPHPYDYSIIESILND